MSEMRAYAYNTHYEIENYVSGKCYLAEKELSYLDDMPYPHQVKFYTEKDGVLYLPRGLDADIVARSTKHAVEFVKGCNPYKKMTFSMTVLPRDDIQKEAIRFLLGQEEYYYTKNASQLVLSLDGGMGKTFCAVTALSMLSTKMMVVCHTADIKNQWRDRIKQYTNMVDEAIVTIDSSDQMLAYLNPDRQLTKKMNNHIVYLITHSLMQRFIENNGYEVTNQIFINLGIGLKVIDEFHKNFANTLSIDYATNVYKTFYLSATAGRTSAQEDKVFQAAFNQVYKLRRTNPDTGNTSTFAIYNIFRSNMLPFDVETMYNRKTFSVHKYMSAEIYDGVIIQKTITWLYYLYNKVNIQDKQLILVLSSTKDSCDVLAKIIQREFPDKKVISYYSGNKVERVWENDIVCATVSMMGTGNDYPNLRAIINLEVYGSAVTADQLVHRLMRGNNIGSTFLIELIDGVVPNAKKLYKKRRPVIDKYVTKAIELDEYKKRKRV